MINLTLHDTIPYASLLLHKLDDFLQNYSSSDLLQDLLETKSKGKLQLTLGLAGASDESFEGVGEVFGSGPEEGLRGEALRGVGQQSGGKLMDA